MRDGPERPRRRVRFAPLRIALAGVVLAGTLTAVAAGHLHRGMLDPDEQPDTGPAAAYAEQQAARGRLVAPTGASTTAPARPPVPPAGRASGAAAPPLRYRFPVGGKATYGRSHHDYPAADIFARCGSAFLAPVDGTIEHVSPVDRWRSTTNRGLDRGGLSVALVGRDGVRYYGSHLRAVQPGLKAGTAVRAGARLGEVGQTGSAEGTGCHLHFGISPACPQLHGTDWWNRRGAVPPAPFLDAWRAGESRSPAGQAAAWQREHGCPGAPTAYP